MTSENDIELALVLLGASEFEIAGLETNKAFARSKEALKTAFLSGSGKSDLVVDLFDTEFSIGLMLDQIEQFLKHNRSITDLLIYYCGHGGVTSHDDLYLTMRRTRAGRGSVEGLGIRALRECLHDWLVGRRVYLLLDCCYASRAVAQWMSTDGMAAHIGREVFSSFPRSGGPTYPRSGTALLAAAQADVPAKSFDGDQLTVFTGALVRTLVEGVADCGPSLSLRDLYRNAERIIRDERAGGAPLPELFPKVHDLTDISSIPLFPNARPAVPQEPQREVNPHIVEHTYWLSIRESDDILDLRRLPEQVSLRHLLTPGQKAVREAARQRD